MGIEVDLLTPSTKSKSHPHLRPRERRLNDGEYEQTRSSIQAYPEPTHLADYRLCHRDWYETRRDTWAYLGQYRPERRTAFLPLTKNGASREVPFRPRLVSVLQQQRPRTRHTPFPVNCKRLQVSLGSPQEPCWSSTTSASTTYAMKPSLGSLSWGCLFPKSHSSPVTKT